jgi:ubiquinone/menaquinone biosynthesis C-methylase UbiE
MSDQNSNIGCDIAVQWNLFTDKKHTQDYAIYRPNYPLSLVEKIMESAMLHNGSATVVDIGCGSGQLTLQLAKYAMEKNWNNAIHIIGLDPSVNQIENAVKCLPEEYGNIVEYRVSSAEHTGLESNSVDVITVAQALHWFNLDQFFAEVDRLLKPDGILAAVTYDLNYFDVPEAQKELLYLYNHILGKYWSPKRKMVDDNYASIDFPYSQTLQRFMIPLRKTMSLSNYINYLNTWSSIQNYRKENPDQQVNILEEFKRRLMAKLGIKDEQEQIEFVWEMHLIIVKKM